MTAIVPESLTDPWLINSEYLLKELARIRGLTLSIPFTTEASLPTNSVVDALWRLEEQLRYLLYLNSQAQDSFRRKAEALTDNHKPALAIAHADPVSGSRKKHGG